MSKNKFPFVILIKPQLPENIGLCARAMMNCGFENLRIVSPKKSWPNKIAINSASHASYIIDKAKIFQTFDEAVKDLNLLLGMTIRKRYIQKEHYYSFSKKLQNILKNNNKIGFVFGPERSGLTNSDISKCDYIFSLSMFNNQNSLNLSHSVLLACHEFSKLFMKNKLIQKNDCGKIATKNEFNNLMDHLKIDLLESGFLYPPEKTESMFMNIQNMFIRANFSSQEVNTFRGILKKLKNPRR